MDHFNQNIFMKQKKRMRSAFTTEQVNYLENEFKIRPYIENPRRKEVASALNISEKAIKIWFQNRRMKEKRESSPKEYDDVDSPEKVRNHRNVTFAQTSANKVLFPSLGDGVEIIPLPGTSNQIDGRDSSYEEISLAPTQRFVTHNNLPSPHSESHDNVQESPIDLSVRSDVGTQGNAIEEEIVEPPQLIPHICTQACLSPNNVMLKPINIMPISTEDLALADQNKNLFCKENCGCNCHKECKHVPVLLHGGAPFILAALQQLQSNPELPK